MKKILLIVIIVLLCVLTYCALAQGITLGNFQILSISQIKEKNNDLDSKIEDTNKSIDTDYPNALASLKTASSKFETSKKEYINLSSLSTEEDIIKATMEESYDIGLLWTKIGNYARNKGTKVEMQVVSNTTAGVKGLYDLKFTVNGSYISIIRFVEAIENDSLLNFRIKNFKLLPGDGSILQATFTINNVSIQGNTSNQSVGSSTTTTTNTSTTNTSTTNSNTNTTKQ